MRRKSGLRKNSMEQKSMDTPVSIIKRVKKDKCEAKNRSHDNWIAFRGRHPLLKALKKPVHQLANCVWPRCHIVYFLNSRRKSLSNVYLIRSPVILPITEVNHAVLGGDQGIFRQRSLAHTT